MPLPPLTGLYAGSAGLTILKLPVVRRLQTFSLAGGARTRRYPTWAPRPAQYGTRSWRFSTLPEPVRGSSAAKSTERGTL